MELTEEIPLVTGHTDLSFAKSNPYKVDGGMIILCLSGKAEILLDMQAYNIEKYNEVLVLTKSSIMLKSSTSNFEALYLYCSQDLIHSACNKFSSSFFNRVDQAPVYVHEEDTVEITKNYISFIQSTINDTQNRYNKVIVTNLLRNLFLYIYDRIQRNKDNNIRQSITRKDEIMNQFMDKIAIHCMHHRDVDYYADRLCISSRYLNAVTKELANKSPKEIIDNQVISEIKTMLNFSDITLSQIAEQFYFPDQSYLSRYFSKKTGMSPLKYRQSEINDVSL